MFLLKEGHGYSIYKQFDTKLQKHLAVKKYWLDGMNTPSFSEVSQFRSMNH